MAYKILIVDDDVETLNFLRVLLNREGYEVVEAQNGTEALNLAQSTAPNLIVLDIMMPDIDGLQVTRELRSKPLTAHIPILIFTAKNQLEDKVAGYEAGVDLYLAKPIHPLELQANIRTILKSADRPKTGPLPSEKGRVVGVVAAKGGLGVSTVALNMAISYKKATNARAIAAELKPGEGTWGIELGLENKTGLTKLLEMGVPDITARAISEVLVPTQYGVPILLATNEPRAGLLAANTQQYRAIIEQMASLAEMTILDIGTSFHPSFDAIIENCNELVLVIDPQPLCIKQTRVLLDYLKPYGFGPIKSISIVMVNRSRADMSMSMSQIEEVLGMNVAVGIPPSGEQAYFSMTKNMPLALVQPDGILAQQFLQMARQLASRVRR
jgi:pilus assembly protein CpaE